MRLNSKFILIVALGFFSFFKISAQKTKVLRAKELMVLEDEYDALSPAKAAFYSAVVPGLGQAYNKKYWKIPIVYGALATSMYYYTINKNSYKRYRKAFKLRAAGFQDEFTLDDGSQIISNDGLERAQKILRQNRDMSLLTFTGLYVLQILEASINAHLIQFNTQNFISLKPNFEYHPITDNQSIGLSLTLNF